MLAISNLDEWGSALDRELDLLVLVAERALVALGDDIGNRERRGLPRGDSPPHAADTVEVTQGRSGETFFVDVGPTKAGFYLAFGEFGTQHQSAHPVMRPIVATAVSAWRV